MKRILTVLLTLTLLLGTAALAIPATAATDVTAPEFVAVQNTEADSETNTQSVRFIALVSSLQGSKIGYEISAKYLNTEGKIVATVYGETGDEYDTTTNKVYTAVQAPDGISGGSYKTLTPTDPELGGKEGDYLMVLSIQNIPTNVGAITFTVRTFVVVDGRPTYSKTKQAFQMVNGSFVKDEPYVYDFKNAAAVGRIFDAAGLEYSYDATEDAAKLVATSSGRVYFHLRDIGTVDATEYSYFVLRVKNNSGSEGVMFTATSAAGGGYAPVPEGSSDPLYLEKILNYSAGTNWQNVVVDYTVGDDDRDNVDAYFNGTVGFLRIDPWMNATIGDTMYIESVAFFRTEAQAKAYAGTVPTPPSQSVTEEIANAPKILFTDKSNMPTMLSGDTGVTYAYDDAAGMLKITAIQAGRRNFLIENYSLDVTDYQYMVILLASNRAAGGTVFAVTSEGGDIAVGDVWLNKDFTTGGAGWEGVVSNYSAGAAADAYFTGTLNYLRFDPWLDAQVGDVMYVHSIAFFYTAEAANAYADSVELADPFATVS